MLTATLMDAMDDEHLIAAVHAEFDPLTGTALERELLHRFEAYLEKGAAYTEHMEIVDEAKIKASDLKALLEARIENGGNTAALLTVLWDAGISDPAELKARLDTFNQLRALPDGAGEILTSLTTLITNAQE